VNAHVIMIIHANVLLVKLIQLDLDKSPAVINQQINNSRKGGRADECVGLENRCGETHRGFESHPFRHSGVTQLAE
jgi:hypothetical protein